VRRCCARSRGVPGDDDVFAAADSLVRCILAAPESLPSVEAAYNSVPSPAPPSLSVLPASSWTRGIAVRSIPAQSAAPTPIVVVAAVAVAAAARDDNDNDNDDDDEGVVADDNGGCGCSRTRPLCRHFRR